jgi:hypothetical protein
MWKKQALFRSYDAHFGAENKPLREEFQDTKGEEALHIRLCVALSG